ncbi:Dos2-interacting transcription regulator of RNA-Pol-II-domain-containing protein [Helicostylum pulchrum]|uniref:MMS19 nucleotide excision repair protein n=1 Tax=Helicostylum pulchrum TaxID=562976 RepID=A0ABP9Y9Z5_9FUNG|nr:Dos2-interacting transcription regulator of RNA-Pol-II-domain-containing protein [Helicostylum pulchrum]
MSEIEKEVTRYMITTDSSSTEAVESGKSLVEIVNKGSVQNNLLELIQELGEYLTNDDEFIRAKATGLLSNTLNDCEQEVINESAVSVLVDFYCDRLTDKTCVQNLLDGLVALTTYKNFTGKNALFVFKRIIENVQVQQFPQGTRNSAFKLFANLINRHATTLRSINNEFVYGFTQVLDGEKDPRNLMSAFQIMKSIVDNFDISAHVEDIFEVTFCYFPVTFKPPPDDPYGITAEDLKTSLRDCLASTPLFAKFALPLILEKLSSTSGSAKKDSMETLAACAPVYGSTALLSSVNEIFNSLKLEVFHAIDEPLEDAAINCIRSVVAALNEVGISTSEGDPTEKALKSLVDECATYLKDPDMKDSKQTGRILRAAASASDPACHYIVDAIIPLVLKQYRETAVATLKKSNVDIMIDLLEAGKTLYGASTENDTTKDSGFTSPLVQHKDRFFAIFETSLLASNEYNLLRLSGLTGLKLMILSKGYLQLNEVGLAVQAINKILLDEQDEELRTAALEALYAASCIDSKYIIDITLPSLINRLPETSSNSNVMSYLHVLHALRTICPVQTVYKHALPLLMEKFDIVCEKDNHPSYAHAIVDTILQILKTKVFENHKDVTEGIDTVIPHIFTKTIQASLEDNNNLILNSYILQKLSLIIITIFSKIDSITQKNFVDRTFKLFVDGQLSEFNINSTAEFKPLQTASPNTQKVTCQLFSAIVCTLRKDVALPISSIEDYLNELMTLALSSDNETQITCASRIIGSLINKWKNSTALTEYVKSTSIVLQDTVSQQASNSDNALEVYLWITKSLILRTHALGYELTEKVIEWCGNNIAGSKAPQGFDILIGDEKLALNKDTFATTTILYKQRFFSFCLPKLVEGFRSAEKDVKPNYLIALSYVLKNVPKQILLTELPPLVPLLIESLSLSDATLKVSTLETFELAVSEAADVIAPQVRTILPSLLELLEDTTHNSIRVRVAALTCLGQFPAYISKDSLAPHASFVLKQLKKPLDDKKRIVRKEAVDCRSKWYTIFN